jgi:hypothetical protein
MNLAASYFVYDEDILTMLCARNTPTNWRVSEILCHWFNRLGGGSYRFQSRLAS